MSDIMKHAKIAYIIPFQNAGSGREREPVLLVKSTEAGVSFDLSLFFIGLKPDSTYTVSYTIIPDDSSLDSPGFAAHKKFMISDVERLGGYIPAAFEVPITLPAPVHPGHYRLEAILSGDEDSPEARKAVSFIDVR
jgi:hypothetical protein